jgi:hypothetical protein
LATGAKRRDDVRGLYFGNEERKKPWSGFEPSLVIMGRNIDDGQLSVTDKDDVHFDLSAELPALNILENGQMISVQFFRRLPFVEKSRRFAA